ncbi:MAG: ATP-dependent zinc metalloprotease FtsH [bacterium]|nr:ATP-dependent zinc metalloprotease FtsH [bacterium]
MEKNPKRKPSDYGKKSNFRNVGFGVLLILAGLLIYASYNKPDNLETLKISEVVSQANNGEIEQLTIQDNEVLVKKPGEENASAKATKEPGTIYDNGLKTDADVKVEVVTNNDVPWISLLSIFVPTLVIVGVFFFILRSAQGQGNQAMSFGKSKARLYGNEKKKITFGHVAGTAEAKQDLEEVVDFLKNPKKFEKVGAKIPKGVLLIGPPGTGKTLLARAVAGEAGVPFFSISGSEFVEMFVGVGASRVRDLFAKAKKNAPCIIFVDEIDAVGRRRGSGMGGGHDEREQTLNQILVEMDGFEQGQNVIVLAATNRKDVLDPALLRPGRFDRQVNIVLPDRQDRLAILKVHFKEKPLAPNTDLDSLAAKTVGSSGADLENMANEAAIIAARHDRKVINQSDVTEAFEKVAIGPERKNKIMSKKDKDITAYHEAGHAIVGHVLPDSDMVHKVTIIPRGGTGGSTWFIPPEDKSYHSIVEFKDILARALGGRIAEEVVYGRDHVTTGAGSDLLEAAKIARDMVINQGMGKKLQDQVFHIEEGMMIDRMVSEKQFSDETAKVIDDEVEALITEAATRAREVIKANKKYLEDLKDVLLKKETVDADEVLVILKGAKLPPNVKLH